MPTIIDGYNLLRTCGFVGARVGPGTLERARGMLLGFLAQVFAPEERGEVTVVFDSAVRLPDLPDYTMQNGIHVHFATAHRDADELIVDMLQRHSAPKSLMIVSSDHQIQKAAARRRARFCDSDRWYEDTIETNRSNPRVVATAAEIALEIQLLRKELAAGTSDPEQEHLLSEFSKSIATFLPTPPPIAEPEPPPVLDLAAKPVSRELRHGALNDETMAEVLQLLDGDFLGSALGKDLKPQTRGNVTPHRVVEIAEPSDARANPNTIPDRESNVEPESKSLHLSAPAPSKIVRSAPSDILDSNDPATRPDRPLTDVPSQQLDRWNRQLKETDITIFPPGYGEDVIFSESFEIDNRLKKKPRT
ncbi:MAG: NYN domain-containing protein [Planctomycetaceae bacterium]|nr:NYN domain-containing protein [Planctomycetaceae bacterium]